MGHVFVMRGDLQALRCDDWLMPCSAGLHVSHAWWVDALDESLRAAGAYNHRRHPKGKGRMGGQQAIPLAVDPGTPRPWLVDTTGSDPERVTDRARAFVAQVAQADLPRCTRRTKRLIALPVVGTGAGGTFHEAGEVLRRLLPALREAATTHDVDVALVTWEAAQHAAAQAQRSPADFKGLPRGLRNAAKRLARQALHGRLVLFLGAGVSMGAGLPDWHRLLTALAQTAGLSAEELALYQAKHALDRAEYVALRLAQQGRSVGQAVCEVMGHHAHYGLAHGLLAGLPVTESVTTNYDQLFEQASEAAGRPLAVLPWQPTQRPGPWLLKMHGCLDHPDDIILTRQNYVRYAVRNAALAGIVQAMLITKHMVFIGFSLQDDNFLRIVDEVRRAVHPDGPPAPGQGHHLGTALMLAEDQLAASLWAHDMHWEDAFDQGDGIGPAARRLEIFLDEVGFRAATRSYLMDGRFEAALDSDDRALRDLLIPLTEASAAARRSPAFEAVRTLLTALGGRLAPPGGGG